MNVSGQTKPLERILVVSTYSLRLLIPDTYEEVGKFPYKRMKEFSHNFTYKMFQFSWYPSSTEEETFYFHTSKCLQIQSAISDQITALLKEQKIDNPEDILKKCTYHRAPQVQRMKVGGRQRSTNNSPVKAIKKEEKPSLDQQSPRKSPIKKEEKPSLDQQSPRKSPIKKEEKPSLDQQSPRKPPIKKEEKPSIDQQSPRKSPSPEKKLLTAKSLPPDRRQPREPRDQSRQKRTPIKRSLATTTTEKKKKRTFIQNDESEENSISLVDSTVESV